MFQFPAFAPRHCTGVTGSLPPGCPIRRSAAMAGICPSPRLFAACHVLLRLREPRHPPCALFTTCFIVLKKGRDSKVSPFPAFRLFKLCWYTGLPLPPSLAGGARSETGARFIVWLCLTLGFLLSPRSGFPPLFRGPKRRFPALSLSSFPWVVRGRVELPTSTLSV